MLLLTDSRVSYTVQIVLKKQAGQELTEEILEDPGLLHQLLAKLPNFVLDSKPGHTRSDSDEGSVSNTDLSASLQSLSTTSSHSHKHLLDSIYSDTDVEFSGLSSAASQSQPSQTSETAFPPHTPTVSVEETIQLAADLWRRFPLDSKQIKARQIMGPKSAIFTWREGPSSMSPSEAQAIVAQAGPAIVLPGFDSELNKPLRRAARFHMIWMRLNRKPSVTSVVLVTAIVALAIAAYKPAYLERRLPAIVARWMTGIKGYLRSFSDALGK
jgi:hypothetical protein